MSQDYAVIYWDASALLSYLFRDELSDVILEQARKKGVHLVTSVTLAEVYSAIGRIYREELLPSSLIDSLFALLDAVPFSRLNVTPKSEALRDIAYRWQLKGSVLWHLATAKTLQEEFPELMLLTLDEELAEASSEEQIKLCLVRSG